MLNEKSSNKENGAEVVKFASISAEVKSLILKCVEDGNEHERKEIVAYIREHIQNKDTLTDGIVAGGFKMLTATGEIRTMNRAMYRKGAKVEGMSFRNRVMAVFDRFQQDLNKACTMNMLCATPEDLDSLKKVSELANLIESELWKFEEITLKQEEGATKPSTITTVSAKGQIAKA